MIDEAGQGGDMSGMREVVLGKGSRVWQEVSRRPGMRDRFRHAIGHGELHTFGFSPQDRVWVLAYSREPAENSAMLDVLRRAGVAEIVYIGSSSTIIASLTHCYAYPRAKKLAEEEALSLPNGRLLTFGLVVEREDQLPAGLSACTTIDEIAAFMLAPRWTSPDGRRTALLRMVRRPFKNGLERTMYRAYGWLMGRLQRQPCVLRPLDLVLRAMGMHWYGYTFLSNRLWTASMTS